MTHTIFWKALRLTLGWILIILGFVGLFVPVLQGLLLLFAGISVLAAESKWARRLLALIKRKLTPLFKKDGSGKRNRDSGSGNVSR